MKLHYILYSLLIGSVLHAQPTGRQLSFRPQYEQQPFLLGGQPVGKDSIQFQVLRFYISGIALYHHGKLTWQEPASYHLLDAAEPTSMQLQLVSTAGVLADSLHFTLGIDSATNAAGAGAGPLDATKGMYWAWQSGYINFKLEGNSPHYAGRKHQFFFHLGGFRGADRCAQQVVLPIPAKGGINITFHLDQFLAAAGFPATASMMAPGEKAVALSKMMSKAFSNQ